MAFFKRILLCNLTILLLLSCCACFAAPVDSVAVTANLFRKMRLIDSTAMYRFAAQCIREDKVSRFIEVYDTAVSYTGAWTEQASDITFLEQMDNAIHQADERGSITDYHIHRYLTDLYSFFRLQSEPALMHNGKALQIARKLKDDCKVIEALILRSHIYFDVLHDPLKAGVVLNDADRVAKGLGYKKFCNCDAPYEQDYAALYSYLENYPAAIEHLNQAIRRFTDKTENGTKSQNGRLYYSYYNRAICRIKTREFEGAFKDIDSAAFFARAAPDPEIMAHTLNSLRFVIFSEIGDTHRADSLSRTIDYRRLDGAARSSAEYMYYLTRFYIKQGRLEQAGAALKDFNQIQQPGNLEAKVYLFELSYRLALARKDLSVAMSYRDTFDILKDSLNNSALKKAAIGAQIRYETSLKEQQINTQRAELKSTQQNIRTILVLAGAFILLLLLLYMYRNYRNAKEKNNLIQSFSRQLIDNREQEQNRLANEMHDGIGQELMLIYNSLEAKKDNHHAVMLADSIDNIRAISRNLFPALLESIGLKIALEQLLRQIDENYDIYVADEINYEGALDKYIELQLFRIVQEAVNNTLKYADARSVKIQLDKTDEKLLLLIMDNGKGFDPVEALKKAKGIGLMSMQQRAKAIGADFQVSSLPDKGTTITLKLSLI